MFNPPSVNFFEKKRLKNLVFNFFLFVALKISSRAFSIRFITLVFIYSKIFNIISIGLMSPPPRNVKKTKFVKKRHYTCSVSSLLSDAVVLLFPDVKK